MVVAPQHVGAGKFLRLGTTGLSEPKHRPALLRIAGALPSSGDPSTDAFAAERRGALALFPVVEPKHQADVAQDGSLDPGKLVLAFAFGAPATAKGRDNRVVRFTTVDSSRKGEAIIPSR
ncbi:hypothetical protein [Kitasatospora aureofaciens]|uniref:hypothetical protein n=1 Tax=Kitasatospora aureofaciens TaxID=1894 RepID=UPI001F2FF8D8|nr:hypothetical protein [Kitasatospora aureofaciens]